MLWVLTAFASGFASFQRNPGGASGPCPMAPVPSNSNDCVKCPAGKTNYAAGETACTYAFSTAAAPDYYQDGLKLVEAKGNIQARFRLPHTDAFSGDATCTQTKYRSADGSCTTLSVPLDGAANTPFGRLMEVDFTHEVDDPPAAAVAAAFLHRPANASRVSSGAHLNCALWHLRIQHLTLVRITPSSTSSAAGRTARRYTATTKPSRTKSEQEWTASSRWARTLCCVTITACRSQGSRSTGGQVSR